MNQINEVQQRRICWPNPDATCLHGGCSWCESGPWKNYSTIINYAKRAGVVPHRGRGEEDALKAWNYGLNHDFFNRPTRVVPKRAPKKV